MWSFYLNHSKDDKCKQGVVLCDTPWYILFVEYVGTVLINLPFSCRIGNKILTYTYRHQQEFYTIELGSHELDVISQAYSDFTDTEPS